MSIGEEITIDEEIIPKDGMGMADKVSRMNGVGILTGIITLK